MKILLFDIETLPLILTSWSLWDEHHGPENILEDWSIACAAWQWLGKEKVYAAAVTASDPKDDKELVKTLHGVLSSADVIVAHNGDQFDIRKFNARAVFHRLAPIPPVQTIDTKKVAKNIFGFTCNRLDYLARYLGVGKKMETGGLNLWKQVRKGNKDALKKMIAYNKVDVEVLGAVYKVLRPYMRNHPNENLHSLVKCCPTCGSKKFKKQGFKYNRTTTKQQYQCLACHAWFSGEAVKTVKVK